VITVTPSRSTTSESCGEDVDAGLHVKLSRWLVGQQQLGLVREPHRDRHALLFATRQPVGPVGGAMGEPDDGQQLAHAPGAFTPADAREHQRQRDVVGDRQVAHEVAPGLLPHEPDDVPAILGAAPAVQRGQVDTPDTDAACRWRGLAAEDVEQCALAAAGGTDDGHELPTVDGEVQALQRDHLEVGDLVDLDQVVGHDVSAGTERCSRLGRWVHRCSIRSVAVRSTR
jgi:hypothetical protein